MEPDSPAQQRVSVALPAESDATVPEVCASDEAWRNAANAAHSRENVLRWMSYLPDDCVRTMIEMGWDITT